ncbi:MAG: TylF/MycF/NovP-related O-methyltransferase [Thermomicrobiales bacterium]
MDFNVYPGSRIERLPGALKWPALAARNVRDGIGRTGIVSKALGFEYLSDGLGTAHYSPFRDDPGFEQAYQEIVKWWWQGRALDIRWRMWIMTACARQCVALPGAFAEFGVYRGGCAYMILDQAKLRPDQTFFLFDTFSGIPDTNLTAEETRAGFGGRLADTSVSHILQVLEPWRLQVQPVEGDVFVTLETTETGPLAFCHLDLNASAPSLHALHYAYSRLLPAGMIIMDDYTQHEFSAQRKVVDEFFADKPEVPLALPTGQGLIVKLPAPV